MKRNPVTQPSVQASMQAIESRPSSFAISQTPAGRMKAQRPAKQAKATVKSRESKAESSGFLKRIADKAKEFALTKDDELKYYEPRTWFFWRGIIMYFFIFSIVGHWMEIPYCWTLHSLFGIVEETYDVWTDPILKPYWVYGIGAAAITLLLMPLKMHIVRKGHSLLGAALKFLLIATLLCAVLECGIGLIINQPDAFGEYPYWNNSILPLNILGQAWLVNDIALALVSLAYVWLIFPFCQKAMRIIGEKAANRVFVGVLVASAVICVVSYL